METRPGTLQMIMDTLGDPKARGWSCCRPNALEYEVVNLNDWHDLDLPEEDDPGNFRAIAAGDARFIGDPDITRCHRFGKNPHWANISNNPARYPEPPFLLTDNPAHRMVYHGELALLPSRRMTYEMREGLISRGRWNYVISAAQWFGMVRVLPQSTDRGMCWIYSDREEPPRGRYDDVAWGGIPFGRLIFPEA